MRTGLSVSVGRRVLTAAILLVMSAVEPVTGAHGVQSTSTTQKERITMHASGSFSVKLEAQNDPQADPQLARRTIDKQFQGELEGTSKGQMLSAGTDVQGSAGYVAIEKVTGKLGGRPGTFILQHTATMNRGIPQLSITVVPDSGTGELKGLTGSMQIIIVEGKHSYTFDYALTKSGDK